MWSNQFKLSCGNIKSNTIVQHTYANQIIMNRIDRQPIGCTNTKQHHLPFCPRRLIVQCASHVCVPVDAMDVPVGKIHVLVAAMDVPVGAMPHNHRPPLQRP